MKMNALNGKAKVKFQSDVKEKECAKATDLSPNLGEAVEKSIVKSSSDEAKPTPN